MNQKKGGGGQRPQGGEEQKTGGPPPLDLVAAKLTDVGRSRDHNEDYVGFYIPPDPQQRARKGTMYVVADGMGGHQAGEVASQGAVELAIGQYYGDTDHDVGTSLVRAFHAANRLIHEQAQADEARSGMGTTLVAAVVLGRRVYVASVGDSRAYLINQKGIKQITEDHSWVGEQVRMGLLTREQARRHPQRNVVTRALGSRPKVEVDLFEGEIGEGNHLLLCTDGVTGHLEDQELAALVQGHPPEEAARQMVALANERGGHDNMGIIIVGARKAAPVPVPAPVVPPAAAAAAAAAAAPRRQRGVSPLVGVLAAVAVVAVLAAAGLGGWWLLAGPEPTAVAALTQAIDSPVPSETPVPEPSPTAGEVEETEAELLPAATVATEGLPVEPTATLAPTSTDAPRPTRGPARTPAPTAAETRPTRATPAPYPAPTLSVPGPEEELSGRVMFEWQWDHPPLREDDYFDLRIWSEVEEAAGSEPRGVVAPQKGTQAEVDLEGVASIREYRGRTQIYYWGVVVVRKPCPTCGIKIVGQWSEERKFIYAGPPSPGGPGEPEPTGSLPTQGPPPTPTRDTE